jgi:hypothetical protein
MTKNIFSSRHFAENAYKCRLVMIYGYEKLTNGFYPRKENGFQG